MFKAPGLEHDRRKTLLTYRSRSILVSIVRSNKPRKAIPHTPQPPATSQSPPRYLRQRFPVSTECRRRQRGLRSPARMYLHAPSPCASRHVLFTYYTSLGSATKDRIRALTGCISLRRPNRRAVPWHRVWKAYRKPLRFSGVSGDVLFEHSDRSVAISGLVSGGAGTSACPGGQVVAMVFVSGDIDGCRGGEEIERCRCCCGRV